MTHRQEVAVKTIFCNIEFTAGEPFYTRLLEIPIQHFIPALAPVKRTGYISPEAFRVIYTSFISLLVIFV
jgi:hypothetical protein